MPSIGEKAMLGYEELLNDTCMYQKYIKENRYNEKEWEDPEPISCFISYDLQNEMEIFKQDIVVTKKVFIGNQFEPNQFDKIDGLEIKSIKPIKGLLVPTIGWEIVV